MGMHFMNDPVAFRIARLYAGIGASVEREVQKLKANIYRSDKGVLIHQDFSAGMSTAEMANRLNDAIELLASFEYLLSQWLSDHGKEPTLANKHFRACTDLSLLHDLWNADKHPGGRPGKYTGKVLHLERFHRQMKLQTQAEKGSTIGMTMATDGSPIIFGDGKAWGTNYSRCR